MEVVKWVKEKVGFLFLFLALMCIFDCDYFNFILFIIFLALACICLPIFNDLCKRFNCYFSRNRKIALAVSTFLIPLLCISYDDTNITDIIITIIVIFVLWFVSFSTNDKHIKGRK